MRKYHLKSKTPATPRQKHQLVIDWLSTSFKFTCNLALSASGSHPQTASKFGKSHKSIFEIILKDLIASNSTINQSQLESIVSQIETISIATAEDAA